jgi:rSAM/selenodomain-associated transferase 1
VTEASAPVVLGVMARAPVPGRCKTRLAASFGDERSAELYAAMLADTLAAFSEVPGLRRVILAAPEDDGVRALGRMAPGGWEVVPQQGEGLGARLSSALSTLGAAGSPVVLVDSDSPTKPMAPIAEALGRLRPGRRALVGPCDDGGYYLIGVGMVEPRIFDDIPWSTSRVLPTTRARCREHGLDLEELPAWYDVDEEADLRRLRHELSDHPERAPRTAGVLDLTLRSRVAP